MSAIYKKIGLKIKKSRKALGLSSIDFSHEIGISAGQLSNIENGNYDVFKLELLYRICEVLKVPLGEIIEFDALHISDLRINEVNNIVLRKVSGKTEDETLTITHNLNILVNAFLSTICTFDCDIEKTDEITRHIIDELDFIKKFSSVNEVASTTS